MPTVLFSLLATVFPNPAPTPAARPATTSRAEARFDSGGAARGIPVEIASAGLVFVRGRVKDSPFWFLLDSAAASAFGERQAVRVGLKEEDSVVTAGQEKKLRMGEVRNLSIQLPGVTLTLPTISCFDLDPLQVALGHPVDGILGSALFGRLVVEIDFDKRFVSFADPATYANAVKGAVIPMSVEGGLPYVFARMSLRGRPPLAGEFLIDTAADKAVQLFSPFVKEHRLLAAPGRNAAAPATESTGENLEGVLRAETFEFGSFVFRQAVVSLSRSTLGKLSDASHAGLIGGEILSRFKVTFDSSRGRLTLEKNSRFADPFDYDASGVVLEAQGPDLSTLAVQGVLPGSPGEEAGLKVGDVLLAVDGKPVKEISLRATRRLFRQAGREFELSILREGAIRKIRLKCRKRL